MASLIGDSLRAHALIFERPLRSGWDEATGRRILLAFLLVAVGVFHALRATLFSGSSVTIAKLAFVALLTIAFVLAHRLVVRMPLAAIGLRRVWTRRETLYAVQVGIIAAVAFALVFRAHFTALLARGIPEFATIVATGLLWGAVQEFLYRGWLQSELVRRFGAIAGLLVANLVFTFGPLHANWLFAADGPQWGMIGAIFAIGLLFGVIFQRSGNLWIVAILHGLWPLNMS